MPSLRGRNFHLGTEREQCRRKIAGERRMAMLALRRHVTDIALVLEAIIVGAPPRARDLLRDVEEIIGGHSSGRRR